MDGWMDGMTIPFAEYVRVYRDLNQQATDDEYFKWMSITLTRVSKVMTWGPNRSLEH